MSVNIPIHNEQLYAPTTDEEVRRCQLLWIAWLKNKVKEAENTQDRNTVNHWNRLLSEFIEKTKVETYISPFTGRIC